MQQSSHPSQSTSQPPVRHYVSLFIAQLAMGSGALFGRVALAGTSAPSVAAARMVLVSVPLVIRQLIVDRRLWGRAIEGRLVFAAILLSAQFFLWTQALSRLSVAATTLLVCCTPLWNGIFDVFVRKRRLPVAFWLAMALALGGVGLLVTGNPPSDVPRPGETALGVALATGCSLASASYLLLVRQVTRMQQDGEHPPMIDIITRTFAGAAVVLSVIAVVTKNFPPPLDAGSVWLSILGMAVITQGIGHSLQNVSLKHLPARMVSFATLVEPLIATLAASLFFGESISIGAMGGGLLILIGVGWAMRVSDP